MAAWSSLPESSPCHQVDGDDAGVEDHNQRGGVPRTLQHHQQTWNHEVEGKDNAVSDPLQGVASTLEIIRVNDSVNTRTPATGILPDEATPLLLLASSSSFSFSSDTTIPNNDLHRINQARRWLYLSYFLSQFAEQAYQFALTLFLAAVANYQSLIWFSTYGMACASTMLFLGATAGGFVDRNPRWYAVRLLITGENVSILIATACAYCLLVSNTMTKEQDSSYSTTATKTATIFPADDTYSWMLLVGIHVFGSLAAIFDRGLMVAWERDWVVVMSQVVTAQKRAEQEQELDVGWTNNSRAIHSAKFGDIEMATSLDVPLSYQQQWTIASHSEENKGNTAQNWDNLNDIECDSKSEDSSCSQSLLHVTNSTLVEERAKGYQVELARACAVSSFACEPDNQWLSETNVFLKQISFCCKGIAPALTGVFIDAFVNLPSTPSGTERAVKQEVAAAALFVGAVSLLALVVEYLSARQVYRSVPELSLKLASTSETAATAAFEMKSHIMAKAEALDSKPCICSTVLPMSSAAGISFDACCTLSQSPLLSWCRLPQSWLVYFQQPVATAGLCSAAMYLNLLTFQNIMTGYLDWRGMRVETVGNWRGIASAAGFVGTLLYGWGIQRRVTVVQLGMWGVACLFVCVSVSYFSLLPIVRDTSYMISMSMLIGGVCVSRVGVGAFEIATKQLMQECVPDGVRGVVGGVQYALMAFFMLLSCSLGLLIPDPQDFHIYSAYGYVAVGFATLLYFVRIYPMSDIFATSAEQSSPKGVAC